ncbi:MAG: redoxin domain-containing protein, partial [Actinomycetota bacterium]
MLGSEVFLALESLRRDGEDLCTKQLNEYNDGLEQFSGLGAQVLAISAQGLESKDDFAAKNGFGFPLLAD